MGNQIVRRKKRKRGRSSKLWAMGARKCTYCGCKLVKSGNSPRAISGDHVKPLAAGGYDKFRNIVPACRRCNNAKGMMSVDEFRKMQKQVQR